MILDEPTTALDVTTQIEVLRAFRNVVRELHTTAVYVSHDLAVVAQMADRVVVLQGGRMQETAPIRGILTDAQHPYTRSLLDAVSPAARVPAAVVAAAADAQSPLLEVSGLLAGYGGTDKSGNAAHSGAAGYFVQHHRRDSAGRDRGIRLRQKHAGAGVGGIAAGSARDDAAERQDAAAAR